MQVCQWQMCLIASHQNTAVKHWLGTTKRVFIWRVIQTPVHSVWFPKCADYWHDDVRHTAPMVPISIVAWRIQCNVLVIWSIKSSPDHWGQHKYQMSGIEIVSFRNTTLSHDWKLPQKIELQHAFLRTNDIKCSSSIKHWQNNPKIRQSVYWMEQQKLHAL